MLLNSDEVRELTDRIQHSAQARVLRAMGIEHRSRPDGSLAVLRSHAEEVIGGASGASKKPKEFKPNWAAANA